MMFNSWTFALLLGVGIVTCGRADAQAPETTITLTSDESTTDALESPGMASGPETSATQGQGQIETSSTLQAEESTSTTLPEGVIYQVLQAGTGRAPASTETLRLHYTLYLIDGTKVESSRELELPLPLKLKVGQGDFIKGFEIGIAGMKIGEVRRIYIPAELGYGETGKGPIPANTPLLFQVELVDAV